MLDILVLGFYTTSNNNDKQVVWLRERDVSLSKTMWLLKSIIITDLFKLIDKENEVIEEL